MENNTNFLRQYIKETIIGFFEEYSTSNSIEEAYSPSDKKKWAYAKSQAKKKFKTYPSAYANLWASKKYKELGGGWRKKK